LKWQKNNNGQVDTPPQMSKIGTEIGNFRVLVDFTPEQNWINFNQFCLGMKLTEKKRFQTAKMKMRQNLETCFSIDIN
jgi:hypothetical protein